MIRARLNAKGQVAAPGAAFVLGRSIGLAQPDTLDIDAAGFLGGDRISAVLIEAPAGLDAVQDGDPAGAQSWRITFAGQGKAKVAFTSQGGREWSGAVTVGGV